MGRDVGILPACPLPGLKDTDLRGSPGKASEQREACKQDDKCKQREREYKTQGAILNRTRKTILISLSQAPSSSVSSGTEEVDWGQCEQWREPSSWHILEEMVAWKYSTVQGSKYRHGPGDSSVHPCGKGFWDTLPHQPFSQAGPEFLKALASEALDQNQHIPVLAPPEAVIRTSVLPS